VKADNTSPVWWKISKTGENWIEFARPEGGFTLDKIVLELDKSSLPSGNGPAETIESVGAALLPHAGSRSVQTIRSPAISIGQTLRASSGYDVFGRRLSATPDQHSTQFPHMRVMIVRE
jgi:hypothetical protein